MQHLGGAEYTDALRVWQRHERARQAGAPIVSVWIGDAAGFERALARPVVWSSAASLEVSARDWWQEITARRDLPREAFLFLARELGESEQRALDVARAARSSGAPEAAEMDSRTRSAAERRLFELLEQDPVTQGLFELNGRMPFTFGNARAEDVERRAPEVVRAIRELVKRRRRRKRREKAE